MRELKMIARYMKKYLFKYILGVIALFAVDYVNAYIPQFTGEITNGLKEGGMTMETVLPWVWRILGMGAIVAIGRFAWRYYIFGPARSIEKELRNDVYAHLETLSTRYYNNNKTGDLMAHFTNDLPWVRNLVGMTIISTFDSTVMLILVLWRMVHYVDASLTFVVIIPLLTISIGDYVYGKAMHKRFLAKQEAFSHLSDQVQESVSGIRVIKAFVQERRELHAFAAANLNSKEKNLGVVRLQALVMPLLDLIIGCASMLTLLYGGYLAIHGSINVGQFIAFNSYIGMLVWPLAAVGECISTLSQGLAAARRIITIFDEKPEITDEAAISVPSRLQGEIEFRDLSFSYPDMANLPVLEHISLRVEAGQTLAVIGRTGCGKTTLANLLVRLYDAEDGAILIDGRPLRAYPLSVLRQNIAYVPQDNFLFSDTLERNIAFGYETIDHEAVVAAAKAACIHDNIMDFPDQYQTIVGERGVTVSGGQKQRCAIARALMKDAPILILDDSLSAVDTDTEEQILQNLKSRRISAIQHADHILVLDEGRMAEYGTHEELLALGGIYRAIFEKQQLEKQLSEDHPEGGEGHVL